MNGILLITIVNGILLGLASLILIHTITEHLSSWFPNCVIIKWHLFVTIRDKDHFLISTNIGALHRGIIWCAIYTINWLSLSIPLVVYLFLLILSLLLIESFFYPFLSFNLVLFFRDVGLWIFGVVHSTLLSCKLVKLVLCFHSFLPR